MKILIVASQFPPVSLGGVSYVSFNLYRSFLRLGHDVHVLAFTSKDTPIEYPGVISLGRSPLSFLIQSYKNAKNLHLEQYHVIFIQCSTGAGLMPQLKKIRHSNVNAIAHVSTYQEMKSIKAQRGVSGDIIGRPSLDEYQVKYVNSPIIIFLEHFVYRNAAKVVGICEATRKMIINHYGVDAKKTITIPNGVDLDKFTFELPRNEALNHRRNPDRKIILFVGVLRRSRKGAYHLLEFFSYIRKSRKDIDLWIVGDGGHRPAIQKLIDQYELSQAVCFCGKVANEKLPYYYSQADVTIVPSIYEGLPLVVLESLACGTPVAATSISGNVEIINEKNGVLLPIYDPRTWQNLVLGLMEKKLDRGMVRNSVKHLDWNTIAKKYIDAAAAAG